MNWKDVKISITENALLVDFYIPARSPLYNVSGPLRKHHFRFIFNLLIKAVQYKEIRMAVRSRNEGEKLILELDNGDREKVEQVMQKWS